jgi:exonuclease VII large subunit
VDEAARHIGKTGCVQGKVVKISQGEDGMQYIDFCKEHAKCRFAGVVFTEDLRDVGDIRALAGHEIEVHGSIREYEGHAEIIVSRNSQLHTGPLALPPVPREYDVQQRGHYSAGRFKAPKRPRTPKRPRRQPPLPAGGVAVPDDSQQ